jgi:hypothetical protein
MIPVLDQLNLGSCTGNALVGAAGTTPVYEALPAGHPALNEAEAVKIYSRATVLDGYTGTYPPDDTGSDGLSVCKAAIEAGLLSGYTHCFSLADALQALTAGPVLFGITWYSSFDSPASNGLVAIASGAYVRGGHEIVGRGIDITSKLVFLDNSWGPGWGNGGSFCMSWATLDRLLAEDGDATVPVPSTEPPPEPVPVPVPEIVTAADRTLAEAVGDWPFTKHYYPPVVNAAQALASWEKTKGLAPG